MGAISLARDLRDGKTKSAFDVLRVRGPVKLVPCEKHSVSLQPRWGNAGLTLVATLGIWGLLSMSPRGSHTESSGVFGVPSFLRFYRY